MGAAAYAYKPQLGPTIDPRETNARRGRRTRLRLAGNARKFVYCILPLALILLYVGLMAGLTAQTYKLAADQKLHAGLLARNDALRSRVEQLESVDRLQAVARQLHMTEPTKVAFVATPRTVREVPQHRFALFVTIVGVTRWIGVR